MPRRVASGSTPPAKASVPKRVRMGKSAWRTHDWDDPGRPGKGWRQLVPSSPQRGASRGEAYLTSSSGRSRVRSVHTRIRNCAARRDQKPRRTESGARDVSTRTPTQLPQRLRLLLRRPERHRTARRDDPAKRPHPKHGRGAQGTDGGAERTDLAKSVNLLDGAVLKTGSPHCQAKRSLRGKEVRPVTRGQRPVKSRRRPRGKGADAKEPVAGVSAPRPSKRSRQGAFEPGVEASLKRSRPATARTGPP